VGGSRQNLNNFERALWFLCFFFVSLQKQLFDRKQKDGESLKEFSHSLWALIENVQRA